MMAEYTILLAVIKNKSITMIAQKTTREKDNKEGDRIKKRNRKKKIDRKIER